MLHKRLEVRKGYYNFSRTVAMDYTCIDV